MRTNLRSTFIGLSLFLSLLIFAFTFQQSYLAENVVDMITVNIFLFMLIMLLAGMLDGLNPCAFSTLLIWIGFLLNRFGKQVDSNTEINDKRKKIILFATFYALGIFIVYFSIGVGLLTLKDVINPDWIPYLIQGSGIIVVIFGLLMLRDGLFPEMESIIKMPKTLYPLVRRFNRPTSVIAAIIGGAIIGLCSVPCSGAIYMAILTWLSSQLAEIRYGSLLVYNIGFIFPVLLLAFTISSRPLLTKISQDFLKSRQLIKIILSVITVILGITSIYLAS